ncbi:unnamed protein product [Microthlaspi erraticum]|uniref:X8 domain-containing protein n=1 Tax=Microthlaspi erraticum TaxID=1685480 RepID=A0A6D2J7J1_9BRAS|nr:unnamed protein product [Microthlaspi erraticum]CAA7047526.1 unnamed protein product [Microthlaspi erraticum]
MSSQLLTLLLILSIVTIHNLPVVTGRKWCMARNDATYKQLQFNIDFSCSHGVDCKPIQPGGSCFYPNILVDHASYAMNAYYRSHGSTKDSCSFNNSSWFSHFDPSKGSCVYT